jgi:hypothetical protein
MHGSGAAPCVAEAEANPAVAAVVAAAAVAIVVAATRWSISDMPPCRRPAAITDSDMNSTANTALDAGM